MSTEIKNINQDADDFLKELNRELRELGGIKSLGDTSAAEDIVERKLIGFLFPGENFYKKLLTVGALSKFREVLLRDPFALLPILTREKMLREKIIRLENGTLIKHFLTNFLVFLNFKGIIRSMFDCGMGIPKGHILQQDTRKLEEFNSRLEKILNAYEEGAETLQALIEDLIK